MANPLNNPNLSRVVESTGEITWNGPAIACLGICSGEKLNKVVAAIANKVCELTAPMDLSKLTLQCALDIFNKDEAGNRTLANVLQLLIDNECGLKELIDNIQGQIDGIKTDNLVLDLKCLSINPGYTTETVLQGLINAACELYGEVKTLDGQLGNLDKRLTDHINAPVDNQEVSIATCVTPDSTIVSQSVIQLAAAFCDFRSVVGTKAQIQTSIARQTSEVNQLMAPVQGWIASPVTEAQSVNNQWLFLLSLHDRISNIENNCCKISCKDVKVGFDILVNDSTISIAFSSLAGTSIPNGLTDQGSTLILTDKNGVSINYVISVANDKTRGDFPFSGLSTDGPISVSVISVIGSDSLHCQSVTNKTFSVTSVENCCIITNNSALDNTIVYQIN